jgi:PD-(D/E)XK nuclease superfamily
MTESPFLPNTHIQFAWDSTSLGWFKECPRKYFYSMIEGWRSQNESVHLRFGIIYHSSLELYDRLRSTGVDHNRALLDCVRATLVESWPWPFDHSSKTRETLVRSIIWYLEQFREDPAKTVQLNSGKPAVELSFSMELEHENYLLCGHLDRVVEFNGLTFVMDRKTASSTLASNYFEKFDVDNQMSLYSIAAKVLYQMPIRGVIIDAAQIAVGFTRFVRGFTYRTPAQLDEWIKDIKSWVDLAAGYARSGNWPMNDKSCDKYGGCPFRKVCSKDPGVRQIILESDFVREPWNPLEPR